MAQTLGCIDLATRDRRIFQSEEEHPIHPSGRWVGVNKDADLSGSYKSCVIEMTPSDHISFADIQRQYGSREKEVIALMQKTQKIGSYLAWRKRVRIFGDRREHSK